MGINDAADGQIKAREMRASRSLSGSLGVGNSARRRNVSLQIGRAENGFVINFHGDNPNFRPFAEGDEYDPLVHEGRMERQFIADNAAKALSIIADLIA